jgi:hypothetical protein
MRVCACVQVVVHGHVHKSQGRTYEWRTRSLTFWKSHYWVCAGMVPEGTLVVAAQKEEEKAKAEAGGDAAPTIPAPESGGEAGAGGGGGGGGGGVFRRLQVPEDCSASCVGGFLLVELRSAWEVSRLAVMGK